MSHPQPDLEPLFELHVQTLAITLRPASVRQYRSAVRLFSSIFTARFRSFGDSRNSGATPHLLGWFRHDLRRLFQDLAANGHSVQPDLIRREDFPAPLQYLPRPLCAENDQRLQQELRRTDDLLTNALLLTRVTGIRIGECIHLTRNCLRQLAQDEWALHVPLGKLHTERLVPVDAGVRRIVSRILALRSLASPAQRFKSEVFLLPRRGGPFALFDALRATLAAAAKRAGCSCHVTPHQLRHYAASRTMPRGSKLVIESRSRS